MPLWLVQPEDNPYKPGFGTTPEYLAGRNRERKTIGVALGMINKTRTKDGLLQKQPNVPIILVDAEQGITVAQTTRNGFYSGRFNELMQRQLLEHASHTIRWMGAANGPY